MLSGTRDETFSILVLVREFITMTPRRGSSYSAIFKRFNLGENGGHQSQGLLGGIRTNCFCL